MSWAPCVVKPTLPGWMKRRCRKWLARQAATHDAIIEVGVWRGRTTKVLAHYTKGTVWAVDHFRGVPHIPTLHEQYRAGSDALGEHGRALFERNFADEIDAGKVVLVFADSVTGAGLLLERHGPIFDMVFVDADHSYEGCAADIDAYLPLLRPGGLMSGHDIHYPGVRRAVEERFDMRRVRIGPHIIWSVTV